MDEIKGKATPEQIAEWKEKYAKDGNKIYKYEVDGRVCYLRSVDRTLYAMAASKMSTAGAAKFTETVIEGIWLGGDDTIKKENGYYFGLSEYVDELMNKKKGQLGEL